MSWLSENFDKFVPVVGTYGNGRTAVQYEMPAEDEPWKSMGVMEPACTGTVNLPDYELEDGYIFVKSYSENDGLYELMLKAGHIEPAIGHVRSGFVSVPVCKLLLTNKKS